MDVVQRDYNHPSVIIWAPINESWGVPDVARDPRQQNYIKSLYVLTKTLDNTRLVIDNEGWEHTALTDLYAVHNYARTGDLLYEAYKDMGGKPGERVPRLAPGSVYNGSPFYLSEFGGIAYTPAGANVPAEAWGYSGVEKTAEDGCARSPGRMVVRTRDLRIPPNFPEGPSGPESLPTSECVIRPRSAGMTRSHTSAGRRPARS